MQLAIDAAGCSPAEADQVRRAMGSKRSARSEMEALRQRLYDGMARNGIIGAVADDIYLKIRAFASFGFAESHSISFAFLVYASSWLKLYYPAAFCAALLNAQPMGFYSPQSLVHDAKRHGVVVLGPHVNVSPAAAGLEACRTTAGRPALHRSGATPSQRCGWDCPACAPSAASWPSRSSPSGIATGHITSMADLTRRVGSHRRPGRGAGHRRSVRLLRPVPAHCALGRRRGRRRPPGSARPCAAYDESSTPSLPMMNEAEQLMADLWATGITRDAYPTALDPPAPGCLGHCVGEGPALDRGPHPGHCRRRRHPSTTPSDRTRSHVHQPGGRNRNGERDL